MEKTSPVWLNRWTIGFAVWAVLFGLLLYRQSIGGHQHTQVKEKADKNAVELEKRGIWMGAREANERNIQHRLDQLEARLTKSIEESTRDRIHRSTIEKWREEYNAKYPHQPLPPIPEPKP